MAKDTRKKPRQTLKTLNSFPRSHDERPTFVPAFLRLASEMRTLWTEQETRTRTERLNSSSVCVSSHTLSTKKKKTIKPISAFTTTPPPSLLRPSRRRQPTFSAVASSDQTQHESLTNGGATRRRTLTTILLTVAAHGASATSAAAEKWGVRSFIREKYFEPGLSPEDAAARIKQTAEGLRSIREMLDHMSWRYVIFYIRLKQSYLSQDLTNAMNLLPEIRRKDYVTKANELVENMTELDYYVRTPKVYESYLYYEKTLKSIDDLVALLA
ncbi:PREDICTED: photosynthetic NDH subunit of lumenal location 2, chloroplastic [Tarenaya hassleriana]|uniref:photosynthetic NDH subunit of lumenal location 2, chloroplastic n=1 Tax=Tarenaya hassleriana TaxID=28532 RepID=UPI0008FCEE9E|nr:PREDICTED: photosynthetic NDH subunit of lumenal location 2, chloroplastic [Tarenaya hassleriana]